jgi:hypothetical protein
MSLLASFDAIIEFDVSAVEYIMIYRRTYVGILCEILFQNRAEFSIDLKKSTKSQPQPFRANAFLLVWKTLERGGNFLLSPASA